MEQSDPDINQESLFAELDKSFLNGIFPFSHALFYAAGEEVVVRSAESRFLYYVEKGAVEVSHTIDATRIVVALIGPANFFGEIGFFDGTSRVRDIRATEDSIIRVFDVDNMKSMQQNNPILYGDFVALIAKSICSKFRRILEESEPLMAYSASLSTGSQSFKETKPIPSNCFQTKEWHHINKLVEDFKASIFDLSRQLQQDTNPGIPSLLEKGCFEVMDAFNHQLEDTAILLRDSEFSDYLWGYAFKEIFPYFMRSRFAERAYYKPRGYAGDFLMMEMIYKNEPEGDGKLGKIMDSWCLETAAAKAVRGRRKFLRERLEILCRPRARSGHTIRIMNLACGPTRELFDFLTGCDYSDIVMALCIDADLQALEYANHMVNVIPHSASIRLMNDNVVRWALGRLRHNFGAQDIIYSACLADYLEDRVLLALINRCYDHLNSGGTLIIGNFGTKNQHKVFLDQILQWKLIHRSSDDLREIFAKSHFAGCVEIAVEENGVNLFALAKKYE
ncbi:MAG: cyclic nucleotide-binding domain-containing protein [Methanothrix sp.]|nr:MAG: cyclic nucleotide-binding domain-containing protein [Methanothrix sp.]